MAGRLFVFLLVGVVDSVTLALGVAGVRRQADLERIRIERLVDRVQDFVSLINTAPESVKARLRQNGVPGLYPASGQEHLEGGDPDLSRALARRLGPQFHADRASAATCFTTLVPRYSGYSVVRCWLISAPLAAAAPMKLVIISPKADDLGLVDFDPVYLAVLVIGVGVLAFHAARMAAAPLAALAKAAKAFGGEMESTPLPERGPNEVRDAISAFNGMQARIRAHMVERTQILASITHDLQTPLTRLRLRLEKVDDIALRSRLIDDLHAMQILVSEGLDYARGSQLDESFATVALDSVLESLVEDAWESGQTATLTTRSGCDVEARPRALQRCLGNLLDNALKHGGAPELSAVLHDGQVRVCIRDHGPGIPDAKLQTVFEPFVRLDHPTGRSTSGAGLGLTIAQMLARWNDADLTLKNHPSGGLEAVLTLRRGVRPSERAAWTGDLSDPVPR